MNIEGHGFNSLPVVFSWGTRLLGPFIVWFFVSMTMPCGSIPWLVGWLEGGCLLGFTPHLPMRVGQVLCLLPKSGCLPFSFLPPPPIAKKRLGCSHTPFAFSHQGKNGCQHHQSPSWLVSWVKTPIGRNTLLPRGVVVFDLQC